MNTNMLNHALAYVAQGIAVFPVHGITGAGACTCGKSTCTRPGKHPLTANGFKDATIDESRVRQYWQSYPEANIGIATGGLSGLVVVDVDLKNQGPHWIKVFEEQHGVIHCDLKAASGGGGYHMYFPNPPGGLRTATGVFPGVDVRADGGYIVAPPSRHASGRSYEWLTPSTTFRPTLPAPEPLVLRLTAKTDRTRGEPVSPTEPIADGGRNNALFQLAARVVRSGASPAGVLAALEAENRTRCVPPLPAEEVRQIATSATRYRDGGIAPWGSPRPLPALEPEVPGLTREMLPEALRDWLGDAAERMQCPLEMIAAPALVAFSGLVGRRCAILPKQNDDWDVYPNLWGAIVAPPGAMKTPALKQALHFLYEAESKARSEFQRAMREFECNKALNEPRLEAARGRLKSAAKDGGAQLETAQREYAALMDEPAWRQPVQKRYITNDPTVEKLGEILSQNPAGITVFRDELNGFLMNMERQGRESDRAFYLEAWNGDGKYAFDRIQRGTINVDALCVSILGGIQPDKLTAYFEHALARDSGDDGFLSRFQLVVFPRFSTAWCLVDRQPDRQARARAARVYEKAVELEKMALDWVGDQFAEKRLTRFDTEAQLLFYEWWEKLEHRLRSGTVGSSAFEAHLSKYRKLMPSLALLFHLVDLFDGRTSTCQVSLAATRMAIEWCDFLEAHAKKVYAGVIAPDIRAAHALAAKVRSGDIAEGMKVREINRKQWSNLREPKIVEAALEILQREDWLRVITVPPGQLGGAPSTHIELNPALETILKGESNAEA
jgi:hypothetical protein